MSQYRLHIDVPLPFSEEEAIRVSQFLVGLLHNNILLDKFNVSEINYRLGHDDDRQKSNYLMKNENGHVNNKKCKINLEQNDALDKLAEMDRNLGLM